MQYLKEKEIINYSIINDGYIKAGDEFDSPLRTSVLPNWEHGKYKAISATRSFTYMGLPALELDVGKISDLDNGDRSKDVKVINTPESIMGAIKKLSSVPVTA